MLPGRICTYLHTTSIHTSTLTYVVSRKAIQSIKRKQVLVQTCRQSHLSVGRSVGLSGRCTVAKRLIGSGEWGQSRDVCIRWEWKSSNGMDSFEGKCGASHCKRFFAVKGGDAAFPNSLTCVNQVEMLEENNVVHVLYLRNEHVCTATGLRVTETEASNTLPLAASVSVEVVLLTYARRRYQHTTELRAIYLLGMINYTQNWRLNNNPNFLSSGVARGHKGGKLPPGAEDDGRAKQHHQNVL